MSGSLGAPSPATKISVEPVAAVTSSFLCKQESIAPTPRLLGSLQLDTKGAEDTEVERTVYHRFRSARNFTRPWYTPGAPAPTTW